VPRPLRELNPAVPDGLQQIVNWMLAKDPGQRYPTPERAAQALQVFLTAGGEPARASEEGPNLRKYLTWLETSGNDARDPQLAAARPAPKSSPAVPVRPAAQPAAAPDAGRRHGSKKHKRHKHAGAKAAAADPAAAARPYDFDVELVPAMVPPEAVTTPAAGPAFRLTRRDWLLVALGGAAALLAVVTGIVLARVL
jgi:hypothetical protein